MAQGCRVPVYRSNKYVTLTLTSFFAIPASTRHLPTHFTLPASDITQTSTFCTSYFLSLHVSSLCMPFFTSFATCPRSPSPLVTCLLCTLYFTCRHLSSLCTPYFTSTHLPPSLARFPSLLNCLLPLHALLGLSSHPL